MSGDTQIARYKMLIGGDLVEAADGQWLTTLDPSTEEPIGMVPRGSATDIARAVDAADQAASAWAATSVSARAKLVRELARRATERSDELLEIEVRDTGNTRNRMTKDVSMAVELMEYFAGVGLELKGHTIPASASGIHFTLRQPYGVVGRILAFNHPFMFAASRLAAPLMAGNTVILKPSEESPISTTILAELCRDIFPAGVVNVITGTGQEAGAALVEHPLVKRLTFIGSASTGRVIQESAARSAVKHVSLELGGKNPLIVFPDADPERVAAAAVQAMNFGHQGQSCGSTSRLLIHESLYDDVVERVAKRMSDLTVGDPWDPSTDMGPVNSERHLSRVVSHIENAKADGARLVTGGGRPGGDRFARGYWVEPTLFADVRPTMRLFNEEVFGPVLAATSWRHEEDMVAMANQVSYGLTASIWTNDLNKALVSAKRVQAGYVWVNGTSAHFVGTSFRGVKESGLGSEEGLDELLSFTEEKTVNVFLPE